MLRENKSFHADDLIVFEQDQAKMRSFWSNKGAYLKRLRDFTGTIRFRLTCWYVGVMAVVLVLFVGGVYLVLYNSLHSSLDDLLQSRSQQLIADYDPTANRINLRESDEVGLSPVVEGEIWLLFDTQGKLLQKEGSIGAADVASLQKQAFGGNPLEIIFQNYKVSSINPNLAGVRFDYRFYSTPVVEDGQKGAELVLGRSREGVEETLHRILLVLLLAVPVALLLCAGGGYWLATRAMRPVRTITQAAGEIEETDLSRRLNLKGGNDELTVLASTFDRMIGRLEAAFTRQRQFTADASHELRTPLTIIDLEVNRALDQSRSEQEYRQALQIIKSENGYMSRLVRDLLTLARADAHQPTFASKELDLSDLTLEIVERLVPLAEEKGLELYPQDLPELVIRGNRTYLTQMLTNLIENALKYTGGVGSRVRVSTGVVGGKWAFVRVTDNGPGIPAEHLPRLFDRFYRVDQVRSHADTEFDFEQPPEARPGAAAPLSQNTPTPPKKVGGSGLGLSIVKWVATSHGGDVAVESEVGVGSVFEVRFPLVKAPTAQDSELKAAP
jgi:signal transduction histidine kinase